MKILKDSDLIKIVYIQAQNAEPTPPLGTILGNIGVNTVKFCDEFNKFSKNLPSFFIIKVKIFINENKTFHFNIDSFSITYILKLLKFKNIVKVRVHDRIHDKEIICIKLKDIIILALFKFPGKELQESLNIFFGIIRSMNFKIIK
jgi:large subunit ribosomal protein L11